MVKKLLIIISIISVSCSFNVFAALNIGNISGTYTLEKTTTIKFEIFTDKTKIDSSDISILDDFSPELTNAKKVYIIPSVAPTECCWYEDSQKNKYFITEISDKSEKKYSQGSISSKSIYNAAILYNCTALIGRDDVYKIYQFDANGVASDDGTAAMIYDENGNTNSKISNSNLPVYSNPTGWKKSTTESGYWYYYTDSSTILYNGYAIIINTTDTSYKLYNFNKKGLANGSGKGDPGSADEIKLKYADRQAATQISINNSEIKKYNVTVNTSYNAKGVVIPSGTQENKNNITGSNSSFIGLLDLTSYDGVYYDNSTKQGWKQVSGGWKYYIDAYNYLTSGYAVIADDENNTIYTVYKISDSGICSDTGIKNTLANLQYYNSTATYPVAIAKKDSALEKIDDDGNTADNLEIYPTYDSWKKVGSDWVYEYGGSGTRLRNGYAVVCATRTSYAIYHFNSSGILDISEPEYATPELAMQHATNSAYNKAEEYDPNEVYADNGGNSSSSDYYTIEDLEIYDDEDGWEKTDNGSWRYYTGEDYILYNGSAIIKWDGAYAIYTFNSKGYYTTQIGQPVSGGDIIQQLVNSLGNKKVSIAEEVSLEELESGVLDNDYDDSDYGDDYDDNTVTINGKQYTDSEFLAAIEKLPNLTSTNSRETAIVVSGGHKMTDAPDGVEVLEDEGNTQAEVAPNKLPQLIDFNKWVDYSYVQNNKKAMSGYAIVKWTSGTQGNQYCLAYFDNKGNASRVSELKVSVQKVINDEELLEDVYQPIMWGNK